MLIFLIVMAISVFVGLPVFLIYSVCASASFVGESEELSLLQKNIQPIATRE
jgi:hypothetical protein